MARKHSTKRRVKSSRKRKVYRHGLKTRKQRGGSKLNAPNGSIVNVRLEKGDDYQPFVQLFKEDAEREDL